MEDDLKLIEDNLQTEEDDAEWVKIDKSKHGTFRTSW
jgi:hypothetical protein